MAPSSASSGSALAAFIPLLIIGLIPAFLFKSIAKRKGRNQWLWFLAGFFPYGWVAGIWLASLPDKLFVEDVRILVAELQKFDLARKGSQPSSKQSIIQDTWRCSCGRINSIYESNCPVCGLKRDYLLAKKDANKKE